MRWAIGVSIVLALLAGCGRETAKPNRPAVDRSLTTAEYVARGFAKPDHVWSVTEMNDAQVLLTAMAAKEPELLPRADSAKSSELFGHLISGETLKQTLAAKMDEMDRMEMVGDLARAQAMCLRIYNDHKVEGVQLLEELVELMVSQLAAGETYFTMLEKYAAEAAEGSPERRERTELVGQSLGGIGKVVSSAPVFLQSKDISTATKLAMLNRLDSMMAKAMTKLPQSVQDKTIQNLERSARSTIEPQVSEKMTELVGRYKK